MTCRARRRVADFKIKRSFLGDRQNKRTLLRGPYAQEATGAELILQQDAMLLSFKSRGTKLPEPLQQQMCREMAIKAVGGALAEYVTGIHNAFG